VGALAFVVLQSQTDANAVVADVLADAVAGRLHALSAADGSRLEVLELAARHIRRQAGGTGRGAVAPLLPDATEIGDAYALRMALMDVSTVERLLLGLQHLARLTVGEMAAVMRMSPGEVRERLDDARNRVQALTERNGPVAMRPLPIDQAMSGGEIVDLAEHAGPQGRAVMSHGHSPFDRRLSEHLRREAGRYVRSVSAADVDAASVRHRETRRAHRSGLLAIALVVAAIIVGVSSVLGAFAPQPRNKHRPAVR
jgi:DNA-directed RNA polymerase specialized sigma24 family protein